MYLASAVVTGMGRVHLIMMGQGLTTVYHWAFYVAGYGMLNLLYNSTRLLLQNQRSKEKKVNYVYECVVLH